MGCIWSTVKSNISNYLKKKTFDQVLSVITDGSETLSLIQATETLVRGAQRRMERSLLGLTLRDRNEEIRRTGRGRRRGRPSTRWTDDVKRIAENWLQEAQVQQN
ncbi:uncharacterized protein [Diabrotica undecimpunctata]|uniref:uncharacterized protein n=1 Tax=Diabrotica undecimpunctata TaxID=50387 RepID=UPI003B63C596